jgi:PAS domain S-box-containing protein
MNKDDSFARTVRIAIPLEAAESERVVPPPEPVLEPEAPAPEAVEVSPYSDLFQSLYDGVLITDAAGRIMDVNDRALDFLLYDRDEVSRLNITEIIAGADQALLEKLHRNSTNRRFTLIDAYCLRKDRTKFPAEIAANQLLLTSEGYLCFFVRDITRRKQAEAELVQTISRLKELDSSKSRFVSNVSHELRTPLTIINTFVSLVNAGGAGPVTEQQKECLATVLRNCDRLAELIDNVLDLGRIESGREEFRRRRVNLADLLKQAHHDFLPKCELSHQQLNLDIPAALPEVLCDRDKIAQVLTNLLGNANKFSQENGVITLRAIPEDDAVRLEVEDNGPGIPPEDQGRIFEAFVQLSRPENGTKVKGTGLGLAISRHIIGAHDGLLQLESAPAKGSRFYFTLPTFSEEKNFHSFVRDRQRFLEARDRRLALLVLQPAAAGAAVTPTAEQLPRLQALAMEALNVAEAQTFLFEANRIIIVLVDGAELTREAITYQLQQALGKQRPELGAALQFAYLEPTAGRTPREWLAEAVARLEPLALSPGKIIPRRVLIVDDDASLLKLMLRILNESVPGLELKSTASGYDACIQFGEWKPDLVVLDLRLKDIDGKRVFESMTNRQPQRDTKFLIVSGYKGDIAEMMKLGVDDFLYKPFNFDEFTAKVKALLNLTAAAREDPPAAAGPP